MHMNIFSQVIGCEAYALYVGSIWPFKGLVKVVFRWVAWYGNHRIKTPVFLSFRFFLS